MPRRRVMQITAAEWDAAVQSYRERRAKAGLSFGYAVDDVTAVLGPRPKDPPPFDVEVESSGGTKLIVGQDNLSRYVRIEVNRPSYNQQGPQWVMSFLPRDLQQFIDAAQKHVDYAKQG